MTIFLTILKVLGILVLIVLGVILFLILMLLFYPFCYRIEGEYYEDYKIRVKVNWFFSLIWLSFAMEDKNPLVWLRICGIKKMLYPKPERRSVKHKDNVEDITTNEESAVSAETGVKEVFSKAEAVGEEIKEDSLAATSMDSPKYCLKKEPFYLRIYHRIKQKITDILNSIKRIYRNAEEWKQRLSDSHNQQAIRLIWQACKKILKQIAPRRGKADIRFGLDDPSHTGYATAGMSMFPITYRKGVHIVPDFTSERNYIQGSMCLKGHIQTFPILIILIRLWFEKEVRRFIKQFK